MEGMELDIGVRSKGLMNTLEDRFSYAWVRSFLGRRILGKFSLGRLVFVRV